jgi:hypothetical protein
VSELEVPGASALALKNMFRHINEYGGVSVDAAVRAISAPVVAAILRRAADEGWTTQQMLDAAEQLDGGAP